MMLRERCWVGQYTESLSSLYSVCFAQECCNATPPQKLWRHMLYIAVHHCLRRQAHPATDGGKVDTRDCN